MGKSTICSMQSLFYKQRRLFVWSKNERNLTAESSLA